MGDMNTENRLLGPDFYRTYDLVKPLPDLRAPAIFMAGT